MLNVSQIELNIFQTPITSTTTMNFKILDKCKYFILKKIKSTWGNPLRCKFPTQKSQLIGKFDWNSILNNCVNEGFINLF
jgi:hypothetical protein